jgi:DNA polymerase-3 subunit delta
MIVKSSDADRFIGRPPKNLIAALVFGPDQGLVRERAETLARSVVPDLNDPFRVAELDDAALTADNARLFDEAAAISMLGGRRVVRVRSAGNSLGKLFEMFFDDPKGDALVVVEGGDLAKSSGLRKVFEEAENAAAIQCYADSPQNLAGVVRNVLKDEGLSIAPEALDDAVSRLGSDRGVTRRELEKLALYAKGKSRIELEDVRAVMGDETEVRVEEACDAAGEGDPKHLDIALERLRADDMSAVAIVRLALMHFQKLLLAKAETARGDSIDAAMRKVRPAIHFARASSFRAQLSRWSEEMLGDVLDLLFETEVLCKTTGVPAEAVCSRALFTISAIARSAESRF